VSRKKSVLVVVAHADDMEFFAAGTVARFTHELGYDVHEYILTDNSKGSYRLPPDELVTVSAREAVEAGEMLGLKSVKLEGYRDGDLGDVSSLALREKVMGMIRDVKADIVMSWDPFAPYEDHPDHRATAFATLDAASFSGNPLFHGEHAAAPHPATEAYWFAKSPTEAKCFVDISETIDQKIAALLAHDCQMQFTMDMLMQEAAVIGADVPGFEDLSEQGYGQFIDAAVREWCRATGEPHGMAFAEQFRYQKLGMLDTVTGTEWVKPDFT